MSYNRQMPLAYSVRTPVFEGPLDLLLDLVEKRKLFVSDVSLSQVTDDFIRYIEEHEEFPIRESAEFIVVASTLMLVKSRSLLPMLTLTEEEETSIEDLEKRLGLYAEFKKISAVLKRDFGRNIIFGKTQTRNEVVVFSPDSKTSPDNLLAALKGVMDSIPKKDVLPKAVVKKMVSLEETISKLSERVAAGIKIGFKDFYGKDLKAAGEMTYEKKISIIVGFLALLELAKRGVIRVHQGEGDIEIESEGSHVPNYSI